MSTLVTTNSSKQPVILLKNPAYLLRQIVMTDFHLETVTLLFQVIVFTLKFLMIISVIVWLAVACKNFKLSTFGFCPLFDLIHPGEGLPYKNDRDACQKLLKNTLKSTKIFFDGHDLN